MSCNRNKSRNIVPFIEYLSKVAVTIAGLLVFLLVLVVVNDVVMRYFFNRPTSWGLEISEYLLVYITFLALAYTLLVDRHVNVDLVVTRLSERAQIWLKLFGCVVGLLFTLVLAWKTWHETHNAYVFNWRSGSILRTPLFVIYIIMPLGSILFGLAFVCKIYHHIRDLNEVSEKII